MKSKICIVTPDIVGPVKNGGVGTACYHLAKELVKAGFDLTLLFSGRLGVFPTADEEQWITFYEKIGIRFEIIPNMDKYPLKLDNIIFQQSYAIFQYLKNQQNKFTHVHFMDIGGLGFHTIQAKNTTRLFYDTVLTVTAHSPRKWINDGMRQWEVDPVNGLKIDYMERYSIAYADILICPSRYMLNWLKDNDWNTPNDVRVIPNCFSDEPIIKEYKLDSSHLIFFGRLEKRKGLDRFCKEVDFTGIKKVSFLGKIDVVDYILADEYIKKNLDIPYEIYNNWGKDEALQYIKDTGGLVVMPSLSENLPYSVVECVMNKIAFVTSDVGGIPEIADRKCCCFPNLKVDYLALEHSYNHIEARNLWLELHKTKPRHLPSTDTPLISVIMPFYNDYDYIDEAIDSLLANDYMNFEIIVCDDGSDISLERSEVTVIKKQNGGAASARNYAAKYAKGEYLIFCDSDNVFYPNLISSLVSAVQLSKADCITAAHDCSNGMIRCFLGGDFSCGVLENVFGDTTSIIKRDVFESLGGFDEELKEFEDWAFFAKLMIKGYKLDSIPETLYWYRIRMDGVNANADKYRGHMAIASLYNVHPLLLPFYYGNENVNAHKTAMDVITNAYNVASIENNRAHIAATNEIMKAHEDAIDEVLRAHETAINEVAKAHETAINEVAKAHETAKQIIKEATETSAKIKTSFVFSLWQMIKRKIKKE